MRFLKGRDEKSSGAAHVITMRHRVASLLFTILVASPSFLLAEVTPDKLLDMGIQTASLINLHGDRMQRYSASLFGAPVFDTAIRALIFNDYPVSTVFGPSSGNLLVSEGYMYYRRTPHAESPLQWHSIDLSGRSVSIGQPIETRHTGYSEFIGDTYRQDMLVSEFSVSGWHFDFGFLRSRTIEYGEDPGIYGTFWENLGSSLGAQPNDEFSLYFSSDITDYLLVSLDLADPRDYTQVAVSLTSLLTNLDIVETPPLLDVSLQFDNSSGADLVGASLDYGQYEQGRRQLRSLISGAGGYDAETGLFFGDEAAIFIPFQVCADVNLDINEGRLHSVDLAGKVMAPGGFLFFSSGLSYFQDPLYESPLYGAPGGAIYGGQLAWGMSLFGTLSLEQTFSFNYLDSLLFMSGAYDHPVMEIGVALSF